MPKEQNSRSLLYRVAGFIVDKRKAFYLVYAVLALFCLRGMSLVKVDNDITDYLDKATETRIGLSAMDEEFMTYASAQVMVENVTCDEAELLCSGIEEIEGVKSVEFDDTDKHYADVSALFSVTFDGDDNSENAKNALASMREYLSGYDTYISAELGDSVAERLAKEVNTVMVIVAVIIVIVLLLSSRTYFEVPVLLVTFVTAALVNKGTNFLLGTISFVSDSVAVVLQLALAIDYAIILCHRYTEERERLEPREAVITALCKAIPEISGSCLTTISGLAAMTCMHFGIGKDMGIVLMKSIAISILTVFTLMPGLLYSFRNLIDKSHHKCFIPSIRFWGKLAVALRFVTPFLFLAAAAAGFYFSSHCPYAYSTDGLPTYTKSESQIANEKIDGTFTGSNTLAVLVPVGDYEKEQLLAERLRTMPEIKSVTGLADSEATGGYRVGDRLTPRQFSELVDVDIEKVRLLYSAFAASDESFGRIIGGIDDYGIPLIDLFDYLYDFVNDGYFSLDKETEDELSDLHDTLGDAKKQLVGEHYSRIITDLDCPVEGEETFALLEKIRGAATDLYGDDVLLVGNSTNCRDLSATFEEDNLLISILSILFVMLVLLFTFQSVGIPLILILVIQGSIWINFSSPTLTASPIFFLSYLVVSAIQMGANIDYAIVITNRFLEGRSMGHSPKQAIIDAVDNSFPTIFTSGTILACAGFAVGLLSSDASISSLGICLGRGTLISIFLVLFILPQLLVLGDKLIEKTSFRVGIQHRTAKEHGVMKVNGRINGSVNGRLDGYFKGTITGDAELNLSGAAPAGSSAEEGLDTSGRPEGHPDERPEENNTNEKGDAGKEDAR